MSMMVSFVLSFFPRDVLDEILNLIESVSEDFPSYSYVALFSFYDRRDDLNFLIVNFPFLSSNIPSALAYEIYISQLVRYTMWPFKKNSFQI